MVPKDFERDAYNIFEGIKKILKPIDGCNFSKTRIKQRENGSASLYFNLTGNDDLLQI